MKTILRSLAFFTAINLSGCCFVSLPDKHISFTSDDKKLIHYNKNDESRMVSDSGDTIKITVSNKNTDTPSSTCGGSMCECDQYETCVVNFSVINNKDTTTNSYINADKQNNNLNMEFSIAVSNEIYYANLTLDNQRIPSKNALFHYLLNINGHSYLNVYELTYFNFYPGGKKSQIFYNESFGIIKLAKDSAKTWTLVK